MHTLDKVFGLTGKWALVTGASRGLGRAIASGLAAAGANVVLSATDKVQLNLAAADLKKLGNEVSIKICDLRKPEAIRGLFCELDDEIGGVDILVNNAGIIYRALAEEFPEKHWDEVIEINLKSVFIACQEAAKRMQKKGGGKIINISSILSITGGIYVSAYAASKGGVSQLTKALANEWASRGINVNAIAPGYFVTDFTEALRSEPLRYRSILDRIPAGRWGDPEEIQGTVIFLASPASNYVNGHVLVVDGGWTAW